MDALFHEHYGCVFFSEHFLSDFLNLIYAVAGSYDLAFDGHDPFISVF